MNTLWIAVPLAALIALSAYFTFRRARRGSSCCGERGQTVKKLRPADHDRRNYSCKTELTLGGMNCENCARRVENALNALPDTLARVRLSKGCAEVLTKDLPDEARLRQAVSKAGYSVLSVRIMKTGK